MFLLVSFALASFADSSILEGGCRSSSLLQTSTREQGTDKAALPLNTSFFDLTSWKKLFPTYNVLDLDDELSEAAVALALETCSTMHKSYCDGFANGNNRFNKSAVWKMFNPSVYMAADGSLRTLALLSSFSQCQDADRPSHLAYPKTTNWSALLVSCSVDDGCKAVGPGLDPHAFQFQGHPMAFTNHGGTHEQGCRPYLVNLTSFEQTKLFLPGMSQCEKNWQAFTYNGTLFFSQWLHPGHRVLSCNVKNYTCKAVFDTSTNFGSDVHGSTPYVKLDSNHFVAAAHTWALDYDDVRTYSHKFFAIQSQPPFAVVAQTEWFQLPVAERHAHAEWVSTQYAGGLTRRGQSVILSYGVGDCVSQAVEIPITGLRQALGL